jgi:hypothetical protein
MRNPNKLIGNRTRYLPARSAVSQSTAPSRVKYWGMLLCRTSVWGKGPLVFRVTDNTWFSCYGSTLMAWLLRLMFIILFSIAKVHYISSKSVWKISSTPPSPPPPPTLPPPPPTLPRSTKFLRPRNMCWFPLVCTYFHEHKHGAIFWSANTSFPFTRQVSSMFLQDQVSCAAANLLIGTWNLRNNEFLKVQFCYNAVYRPCRLYVMYGFRF